MIEIAVLVISIGLLGLNIFQVIYWSRQVQTLVDKLMSKNYSEFVQVENLKNPPLPNHRQSMDQELDHVNEEQTILDQLNSMVRT